jgi:FkbM family methyltransferase
VITLEEYEKLNPRTTLQHGGLSVVYATPNSTTRWRVESLFQKEPVTIDWIAGFRETDVLVDVGANVGMYSVWAAKTRGVRVFAFEPESQNFALLNRNILMNGLGPRVSAYCIALSDVAGLSQLHLSNFMAGDSCHSLGEQVDFRHEPMTPAFSQGCVAARLDDLVASGAIEEPDHIKIDVDGFEPKVVAGAWKIVTGRKLRSLLIEVNQNLPDHLRMVADLNAQGFRHDPAQVAAAERRDGSFKGCAEYVFKR